MIVVIRIIKSTPQIVTIARRILLYLRCPRFFNTVSELWWHIKEGHLKESIKDWSIKIKKLGWSIISIRKGSRSIKNDYYPGNIERRKFFHQEASTRRFIQEGAYIRYSLPSKGKHCRRPLHIGMFSSPRNISQEWSSLKISNIQEDKSWNIQGRSNTSSSLALSSNYLYVLF